jgi:hypothetical protein
MAFRNKRVIKTESGQMHIATSSKKSKSMSRASVSGLVCTDCGQPVELTEQTDRQHYKDKKLKEWTRHR